MVGELRGESWTMRTNNARPSATKWKRRRGKLIRVQMCTTRVRFFIS